MRELTTWALVGPGAIGCAVGAALAQVGSAPIVIARSNPFDRLVVEHSAGVVDEPVRVVTDGDSLEPLDLDPVDLEPVDLEPVDVVLLAVKAHQTGSAEPWLARLVGPGTAVVVLQNGVDHVARVSPFVSEGTEIVPCVVSLPASRSGPGRVTVAATARLTLADTPSAPAIAAAFEGSFISVRAVGDWSTHAWRKLMLNAASGGLSTLTRAGNQILQDAEGRELALHMMREVAEVGRAEGAVLDPDLPEQIIDGLLRVAPGHLSSIVVDRLAGRATEWKARNEVVVRLAARHGIDVPVNEMVTTLIRLGEPEINA